METLTAIIALCAVLSLGNLLMAGALAKRAEKAKIAEDVIKSLADRMLVAELCIAQMAKLHQEQAKIIKGFADATPLIGSINEILRAEIEKREKVTKDAIAAVKLN